MKATMKNDDNVVTVSFPTAMKWAMGVVTTGLIAAIMTFVTVVFAGRDAIREFQLRFGYLEKSFEDVKRNQEEAAKEIVDLKLKMAEEGTKGGTE